MKRIALLALFVAAATAPAAGRTVVIAYTEPEKPKPGELTFGALPGVSAPSRVVRSTIEIAISIAHALLVVFNTACGQHGSPCLDPHLIHQWKCLQKSFK